MKCRLCGHSLHAPAASNHDDQADVFLDLGSAPPSNAFLDERALSQPESWYPLKLYTCPSCLLVQVDEVQSHEAIFSSSYVYFSSYSRSWLAHAEEYVEHAIRRLELSTHSLVVEIASNDGYLLQYVKAHGIPCVGIEPTLGTAEVARGKGIETIGEFFGEDFARRFVAERQKKADLLVANNVLAHVPDLNDFIAGMATILSHQGAASVEVPHLQQLIALRQFDTVYHEHFSYFSLHTARQAFSRHGLTIFDVEKLTTHGGSLRIWVTHDGNGRPRSPRVDAVLLEESRAGMLDIAHYRHFQQQADLVKNGLLRFLLDQRDAGRRVVGYGAAAKGNTLLNYAGVRPDLLPYVVDASPYKQGLFLPGSRIPVVHEGRLRHDKPDVVLILPWNLREEITHQLAYIKDWGGQFAAAVPTLVIT